MLLLFIIFFLLTMLLSALTTIPFFVAIIVVFTVIFKKPWIFFIAFLLGLFLDLFLLRPLGQTSLVFSIFILIITLYERKFEAQTLTFVFISSFLGSLIYLMIFDYQSIFFQSFINSLLAVLVFRLVKNLNVKTIDQLTD